MSTVEATGNRNTTLVSQNISVVEILATEFHVPKKNFNPMETYKRTKLALPGIQAVGDRFRVISAFGIASVNVYAGRKHCMTPLAQEIDADLHSIEKSGCSTRHIRVYKRQCFGMSEQWG
ncbi:MAG: hypothetical protein A3F84_16950 [Candidatus Handelsmanbacteria bacterium RIFCSPLOWO2_12_FULL_64_10]|uniref:Uncharacterized protein n=1 Tax=Handelsmanbacteria sp. (strain RIFCSPLOWO2_12_FULL_64_10) TaxID=1817868 RepID=A0A1F6CD60_HANXR|nr:MAG: hypothetical protein A3F84_16950 [Candidatus Handelsmanbacteria bacterium RIFCSPLOWO2_12_FULL_64_10]